MNTTSLVTLGSLPFGDNFRLAALVAEGVPAGLLRDIADLLQVTPARLAEILQIAPRTLMRRLAHNSRLKPDESERTLRVGRLVHLAEELFQDREAASAWFRRPLRALGGASPLEMCASEPGAREVEALLGRVSHGVVA